MHGTQPGEARVVDIVVPCIAITFPVLHRTGNRCAVALARWHTLDLGSRLEWNWARAA